MMNQTKKMENQTRKMEYANESDRIVLSADTIFETNNGKYIIYCKEQIAQGGQATTYWCEDVTTNKRYVARIDDEYSSTPTNNSHLSRINKILKEKNDCFIPLIDYGWVTYTYADETDFEETPYTKPIQILPYCETLNAKKIPYEILTGEVIPSIAKAINELHTKNLIHRDIKPENIYKYNNRYVLGDFGTAVAIQGNLNVRVANTKLRRNTVGYSAPEIGAGFAIEASDWFNFGVTISTLIKGKHVYQNLIDGYLEGITGEGEINMSIRERGLPLGLKIDDPLQILVNALSNLDERKRPTYDEIMQWCDKYKQKAFCEKYRRVITENEKPAFKYSFKNVEYSSAEDLALAFSVNPENWEFGIKDLYRGEIKGSLLYNYIKTVDLELARKIADVLTDKQTMINRDLGLAQVIYHMNPNTALVWKGQSYDKISDIMKALTKGEINKQEVLKLFKNGYIEWRLKQQVDINTDVLKAIERIMLFIDKREDIAFELIVMYFVKKPLAGNVDKLFNDIIGLKKSLLSYSNDPYTLAQFVYLGYIDNTLFYLKNLKKDEMHDTQLMYSLFEKICNNKTAVRRNYIVHGPYADLFWLKTHICNYTASNDKGQNILSKIESCNFSDTHSIAELQRSFIVLKEHQKDFIFELDNNLKLVMFGIPNGQKSIQTKNQLYFFTKKWLGHDVSAAFYEFING